MPDPRILTIDIETSPNLADVWGLWDQNVSLNQLRETSHVMCFAAKWHDSDKVIFYSEFHHGKEKMIKMAHKLLSQADIVVGYNHVTFDLKHLNREFLLAGLAPPPPFQNVDLLSVSRSRFLFPSFKLQHLLERLGLSKKVEHEGHQLWVKCGQRNKAAWAKMKEYNIGDVIGTEEAFDILRPWIKTGLGMNYFTGEEKGCDRCGSTNLQSRGYRVTKAGVFQRFQCQEDGCGSWSQDRKREVGTVKPQLKAI